MTDRATFGDFVMAAHRHLDPPIGSYGQPPARGSVEEVSRSLLRVLTVIGHYLQDITGAFNDLPFPTRPEMRTWARACVEAREALTNSVGFLMDHRASPRWPQVPAASPLARRLDGVAMSLTTGRDLLQTHFAAGSGGGRQHRSEWALVIVSPTATRALLAEIGSLSRKIARQGADLALASSQPGRNRAEARHALNAACQWLWVLNASVQAAHQREPVSTADSELLRAVPVNVPPPRRLPDGSESVTALCEGTVDTAKRLRHLAWDAADRASWSPEMSVTSLHQVAAASTVISYNCEVLLKTLAARTDEPGFGPLSAQLSVAAEAARRARQTWLSNAHALDQITTDTRGHLSPGATEARDLALWTGRLAHSDPRWTPASGPAQRARPPASLAQRADQVAAVIGAAHHVSDTLTLIAQAEREQIRAAAWTGRIYVTTRSLSDKVNIPRPFARAPRERVDRLLAHYRDTGYACRQLVTAIAGTAETTRAPSRVLTTAAAATDPSRDRGAGKDNTLNALVESSTGHQARDLPGPVESTLLDLGVTRTDVLRRGANLDQASARLIIDAAGELTLLQRRPKATMLKRAPDTGRLVNHVLASGDPRAAALARSPKPTDREIPRREPPGRRPPQREPPEREP
jgi:hypothetical protein